MADSENDCAEQGWWTDQRREIWRTIDDTAKELASSYEPEHRLLGGLSIHISAPNPNGINTEISPDEWYVTLPYKRGVVDVEAIASVLSDKLETTIRIRSRTDEWEPGFWLVIKDAKRSLRPENDQ